MTALKYLTPVLTVIFVMIAAPWVSHGADSNPKNRIDFWQNNYDELTPSGDPLAARAHNIFDRVLNAAGRRPGVVPRLFIADVESNLIPLAIAIPDGSIIISRKVLNICYKDPSVGDDRLAFILGHEIAHQLKDDFWHQRFFHAVALSKSKNPSDSKILEEVRTAARATDKVLAKEIQADEQGIVYAAMAGFDTRAVISNDDKVNFFEYVAKAVDPTAIKGVHKDSTHPSPHQRANTVKARLKQVIEKTELYDLGILFYQAGDYEKAALFFRDFLRFFPSREVSHNLATCHHQMALEQYRKWKKEDARLPFKLSLAIDPVTRAEQLRLRAVGSPEQLYREHMGKAVKYYQDAVNQDPAYRLALNNLGCAHLINGDTYKAIALLKDALKLDSQSAQTLNNLGVAFYLAENPAKAAACLTDAGRIAPASAAPLFNLGKIAHLDKETEKAKKYWLAYLELDPCSSWADTIRETLSMPEKTEQALKPVSPGTHPRLEIDDTEDDIPREWGTPVSAKELHLAEEPFRVTRYPNGYMTVSQDDFIVLITTLPDCKAATVRGVTLNDGPDKVAAAYGPPEERIILSKGGGWLYPSQGIAFILQDKKVASWTLF